MRDAWSAAHTAQRCWRRWTGFAAAELRATRHVLLYEMCTVSRVSARPPARGHGSGASRSRRGSCRGFSIRDRSCGSQPSTAKVKTVFASRLPCRVRAYELRLASRLRSRASAVHTNSGHVCANPRGPSLAACTANGQQTTRHPARARTRAARGRTSDMPSEPRCALEVRSGLDSRQDDLAAGLDCGRRI